jgi:alkyl sulfatase BDS1-like metallo-beta-lactamase superfamily hydrolase
VRGNRGKYLLFATLVFGLLCTSGVSAQSPKFMTSYEVESLGDGLYTFRYGPYRNIFLIGTDGVIVTDPIKVPAAAALRAEIAKLTDLPVTYVAYSHSHWDHAVGGAIFKKEGAVFAAQEPLILTSSSPTLYIRKT